MAEARKMAAGCRMALASPEILIVAEPDAP